MGKLLPFISIAAGLYASSCIAAVTKTEDFLDLSLADLTTLNISVSSNYQQPLKSSPGIVRVIDHRMITANGWDTLQQALMHIPGVQVSVSKNGHSNIWIRGVQSRNNNKVLLLIDGVPQNDSYYGNFHLNDLVPMQHIHCIEILNGPGGVVHGANSFAGVIAITTRNRGGRIGARAGVQDSYQSANTTETVYDGQVYADYNWQSEMGNFYLFVDTLNQQGFQPQYNRSGEFYDRDVDAKRQYFFGKYHNQALELQLSYSDYQYPYRYTKSDRWQGYDKTLFNAAAKYQYPINESLNLKLSAFYKRYDFQRPKVFFQNGRTEQAGDSNHDTSATGLNATLLWPISEQRHVSFGLSYNNDWSRNTTEVNTDYPENASASTIVSDALVEKGSLRVVGLFTEYQQQIFGNHWLHLGARYDDLSEFENQSSYRISLTREGNFFHYKILFGTSYRVPNFREYLKKYNPSYNNKTPLQPEQMETLELAVGFTPDEHDILLVWYINRYKDFIREVTVNSVDGTVINNNGGDEYSFNFKEIDISGLELSWNWQATNDLSVKSSVSYLLNASENPGFLHNNIVSPRQISSQETDLLLLSDLTASFQVNYQFNPRHQFYLEAIYYGNRDVSENYQANAARQQASNADSHWLTSLHIQSKWSRKLSFGLGINNLMDKKIYSPALDPTTDYDNQWPGRHVEVNAQWVF